MDFVKTAPIYPLTPNSTVANDALALKHQAISIYNVN